MRYILPPSCVDIWEMSKGLRDKFKILLHWILRQAHVSTRHPMIRLRRHQRIFFQTPFIQLSDVINLIEHGLSSVGSRKERFTHHFTRARPHTGTALQINPNQLLREESESFYRSVSASILALSARVIIQRQRSWQFRYLFRVWLCGEMLRTNYDKKHCRSWEL